MRRALPFVLAVASACGGAPRMPARAATAVEQAAALAALADVHGAPVELAALRAVGEPPRLVALYLASGAPTAPPVAERACAGTYEGVPTSAGALPADDCSIVWLARLAADGAHVDARVPIAESCAPEPATRALTHADLRVHDLDHDGRLEVLATLDRAVGPYVRFRELLVVDAVTFAVELADESELTGAEPHHTFAFASETGEGRDVVVGGVAPLAYEPDGELADYHHGPPREGIRIGPDRSGFDFEDDVNETTYPYDAAADCWRAP